MTRRLLLGALTISAGIFTFGFSGCTTVDTRISEKQEAFHSLPAADQAAVQQGKIREGLPMDAVYIAWGPPSQRVPGRYKGHEVETWVYDTTSSGPYPSLYYGYPYGGYGYGGGYGFGYNYYGGYHGRFHHRFFYDPFYDPFFYNFGNVIQYPSRTVSFQNGRVIAFQFLPPPRYF